MFSDHPFLIDRWDLLVVFLAVILRLMFSMKYKARDLKRRQIVFDIKKYFDVKHIIRWSAHFLTALVLALFVPELFIKYLGPKYIPDFKEWSYAGDFLIGFFGYEMIKYLEDKSFFLVEKYFGFNKKN
jgi:hypothetical protein